MGDPAAGSAAKPPKRSKKEVGAQQGGASKHAANRSPSTNRTKKKKKTDPGGNPLNEEVNLLQKNTYHSLEDDVTGDQPALEKLPRKEKCPPIFVPNKDPAFLRPLLFERDEPATCNFRLCTGGVKLIFNSKDCYHRATQYLMEPNWIEHYTHDDPETRPMKVVLRGLEDMDTEKLRLDLIENGLKPIVVHKIIRRDTTRKFRDQPYLIHLTRGSATLKELQKVKTFDDFEISWERYKPVHREVTQCMRCQRFGHGIRNCRMARRCVDCGGYHTENRCNNNEPKCANCEGGHLASSKACPKHAEFIAIRKKASTSNQPKRRNAPPAFTEANFPVLDPVRPAMNAGMAPGPEPRSTPTWATAPPGLQQQQETEPAPDKDPKALFTPEQLAPIFNKLVARLRGCKSRIDQIYALGLFVIENAF